jgi:LmbE family N-acetylglucosaminyl deacetylase
MFTHDGPGTAEHEWRASGLFDRLPDFDLPSAVKGGRRIVVLSAHPDDETLGAGGLIATAASLGIGVVVVAATAGERSHSASRTLASGELKSRRSQELRAALSQLHTVAELHELGLPDGSLHARESELTNRLDAVIRTIADADPAPPVLVAPWRGDGHPDHEAAGRAAAAVARNRGCELLEYPVWAWHWARPDDAASLWPDSVCLALSGQLMARKHAAIRQHLSQITPLSDQPGDEALLGPGILAHFDRAVEVFVRTRWSLTARHFEHLYEREGPDPWGLTDRWYEQRKRALLIASLPRPRYRHAFEPGCSIGATTELLAERCEQVLALDPVPIAVRQCRERTASHPGVRVRRGAVPEDWPDGNFDLVVLSELGYYCAEPELRTLARRAGECLAADGALAAVHWRHPARSHPVTGDRVHEVLRAHTGLTGLVHHIEDDFVLDVLVPAPGLSVARQTGVLA